MLKKFNVLQSLILAVLALLCQVSFAQNVGINSTGTAPDASAGLDVSFTDRGFLAPRMTLAQRGLISNPAQGLLVYQTDGVAGFYYNSGTSASPVWLLLSTGTSGWSTTGNSSTTAGTNFLGTTDAVDFVIKTNNTERARFLSSGYVGIGTTTPAVPLHVSSTSGNILYLQSTTGGSGTQASIAFKTYGGTNNPTGLISAVDNNYSSYFAFFTKMPGADANPLVERMRITTTGEVAIGTETTTPDASAKLQINSTSQGVLVPRVQLTATTIAAPVTSPATGLLVYNLNTTGDVTPGFYYWAGTWIRLSPGGTTPLTSNYWTYDTNNIYSNTTGSVGIGTGGAPGFNSTTATIGGVANQVQREKFLVNAGTTTSRNAIVAKGSINSYLQMNIQNTSAATGASTDIVATADNGSETTNYVDLGINSSTNNQDYFGGVNDAYLYNLGQDFLIGTGTTGKHLAFLTGGGVQSTNERMRIQGDGKVGIGTNAPAELLEVKGTALFGEGTTRQVKISNAEDANSLDIFTSADKPLRISNNGLVDGASLQLKGSAENHLFSFEGKGGFRYYSRNTSLEKFRVNDGGDIYLTTTGQNTAIDARGNINDFYQFNVMNENSGSDASTDIVATANNGDDDDAYIDMGINSENYDATVNGNTATILNGPNVTYLYGNGANMVIGNAARQKPLIFFTNNSNQDGGVDGKGTERMRILATGEVAIGTSSVTSGVKLEVNGNIKATNVAYSSDRRLKTQIEDLDYGLKDLLALKPVKYNWKDPQQSSQKQIGLIAQDARTVIPELVSGDESKETLSINYTELIPVLINAIKEQQKQIDVLKQQVQKLQK